MVSWRPSGDHSQDSARSGRTSLYSGGPRTPGFSMTRRLVVRLFGVFSGLSPTLVSKCAGSLGLNHFATPPRVAWALVSTG